jgi:hypothetical protein
VYEDCRRDCAIQLGQPFVERLLPSLSIALDGARWLAGAYADGATRLIRRRFAEIPTRGADGSVAAQTLVERVLATAGAELTALTAAVSREYQERWRTIVEPGDDERRVVRRVEDVCERARAAFQIPHQPWSRAWYFSPDVMVAAAGLDAFQRGAFHAVLGEVHATNSLLWSPLVTQHPDPQRLADALTADTRHLTFVSVQDPKREWRARLNIAVTPRSAWCYEHADDLASLPASRPLPAALLTAIDDGESIVVRARDGRIAFDALELFGAPMCQQVNRIAGSCLPETSHSPRVTIGDLTIARERWLVTTGELSFLDERDRAMRFVAARAWARAHALPRHVFYKSPLEIKPCFLDFDSPIYVETFVRLLRRLDRSATVRLVEMLPGLNDLWLVDAAGRRYTAELRFAAQPAVDGAA